MEIPQGFTDITDAPQKWGRSLSWWYQQVKQGKLAGFKVPGVKGTYLRDADIVTYLSTPQPKDAADTGS